MNNLVNGEDSFQLLQKLYRAIFMSPGHAEVTLMYSS